jgi:formate dehydrogenase major subunit
MTNHWNDLANSDCVLIMGSNAAENHPISFKWVLRAQDKGATVIHVDPRFTRTSAKADIYAPLRSGSDIPFLGGLIKYILENKLYFDEYVREYTNASLIVGEKFSFKDGLFSGYDADKRKYDKSQWAFELDENGVPRRDPSLKHPRCVFNLMKKHYERYTVDKVADITGTPKDLILKVYKAYAATGKPDKAGTIMYAMGWTQHSVGVQNIRAMAMIQLLLGNIGVAGGGVNALRGESNVQGSTDQGLLAHIWPGYNPTPTTKQATLDLYNTITPQSKDPMSVNWWQNRPKYVASYLKALYPDLAPADAYDIMPRLDASKPATYYFWLNIFDKMDKGDVKGCFAWGMNPACGGANANKNRRALGKLDWLVNVNIFENETSSFWKGPGMKPEEIGTEVFFLPCAVSIEKEGSVANSGRWMQWRYRGPKPWGETKPDGDIMLEMMHKIRDIYAKEGGVHADPILKLNIKDWEEHNEFSPAKTAKLMNGYFLKDVEVGGKQFKAGQQVPSFAFLTADGSTCSGNWLHAGSFTDAGNMMARRDTTQTPEQARIGLFPNWSFCWPVNRRIIYNRASVDKTGKPWNPAKAVIEWKDGKWVGDVVDGGGDPGAKHPFIMQTHGFGALYGPGREEGPFPEHYEPLECPVSKNPFSKQLHNPVAFKIEGEKAAVCDPKFPFIGTTYRVTEHWQTGLMTRRCAWLVEAEPEIFAEVSKELAKLRGIKNGDRVKVSSLRGSLEAVAIVTERIKPYKVMGADIHMVGLPWHYGWMVPRNGGDTANLLTPSAGDPNTGIPETKAFMVDIRKVGGK